jgi:hypothetical protein
MDFPVTLDVLAPSAIVDGIPVSLLDGVGVVGVVVFVGWLIMTGRWVPRRTYDDKVHEADEWRIESRIKDQQVKELSEQNEMMLKAFGPTLTDFLQSLRKAGLEARSAEDDRP